MLDTEIAYCTMLCSIFKEQKKKEILTRSLDQQKPAGDSISCVRHCHRKFLFKADSLKFLVNIISYFIITLLLLL